VESYSYDVFGSVTVYDSTFSILNFSFFQNRFLFTGREWIGEIGIYDYRNRIYSPELGRFLQTDPIRFDAGDVNLYRYVGNDSVTKVDPYGLESLGQSLGKAGSVRSYKPASPKIPVGKVLPLINAGLAITDQLDCNEKAKQARSSRDETCKAILCPDARAKCLELSALIFRIEVANCAAKAVAKVAGANAILGKLGLN
jgi:RHS repeat-associated protein